MAADPQRVQSVFLAAVELAEPAARAALLHRECKADPDLQQRVEALLQAHEDPDSFLDQPAVGPTNIHEVDVTNDSPHASDDGYSIGVTSRAVSPGTTVAGRYRLLELIGEGGMGTVWMAEQREPMRRMVALKLIKPGMSSKAVLTRFGAERQALALMDHPNIAKVLDGGTTEDGRPYFVMELVRGIPLTQYCDERRLPVAARLDLFVQVCQAVQHAHQKGIIHRDIKPTNILVTEHDGRPVPKVIDFGLAKALQGPQALTEHTMFTAFGAMVGTPLYMAPEQVGINAVDVDTRSDVYALGVILYELLTGSTPLEKQRFKEAAWEEICRLIREEEPPRPSLRLSSSDALPSIAACRHTEPDKLGKLVRGDLDWIVLKALEKDRNRRYETANGLAVDIQRHLADEPIAARPPTSLYRFQKMVRRNKLAFAAGSAVIAALVVGTLVSTFFAVQSSRRADDNLALAKKEASARVEEAAAHAESEKQQKIAEANATLAKQRQHEAEENAKTARRRLYCANMNLAQGAWEDNRIDVLRDLLERTTCSTGEEDLRGFEWYYWNRKCHDDLMTLKGHGSGVASVAFSPDGKRLASCSTDATIKLWDVATGKETKTLKGHNQVVARGPFSPDGQRLASASYDRKTIKLWDVATGKDTMTLKGHASPVYSVAFSPDGQRLAAGSTDGSIKLWDVATGTEIVTLKGHGGEVVSVAFSPDGKLLASCSRDKTIKLWDVATGTETMTLKGHGSEVWSVAFSPDGQRLASGSRDKTIKLWDVAKGQETMSLNGHGGGVGSVAFSPDGQRLASGSSDATIKLWDVATGTETMTLKGHGSQVWSVAFSPDGQRLASGSSDATIKLWDVATEKDTMTLKGHDSFVLSVAFSPDGKRLASCSIDKTIKLWDVATGTETMTLKGHHGAVRSVAFSPDGQRLASGSVDNTIKLWDVATGQETKTLKGHSTVGSVAFSPDGKLLASGEEHTICLWDVATGRETMTLKGNSIYVMCVAFSTDGKRLASASDAQTIKLWDVATGQETMTLKGNSIFVMRVAFSPDGQRLASSSDHDQTIKLWDVATGQESMTLKGHANSVFSVAFSPDGQRLASVSMDQTIKLWDVATGQETLTLKGHDSPVRSVAFSPDGKLLASAGNDNLIKLWDARPLTEKDVHDAH